MASPQFLFTYKQQKTFYNAYTKPGLALFFIVEENRVQASLLSLEEAEAALKSINKTSKDSFPAYCLMTLNGHKYHPLPCCIQKKQELEMQALLIQAQFFTGKIEALLAENLSSWFLDDVEKNSFF